MSEKLFIRKNGKVCEGYLGENSDNIKLLFVMKEPNGEELNCFWLKQVFEGEEVGARYFNNLNIYIEKLFGRKAEIKDELLNKIAFINLFPFFGKSHVVEGKGYSALKNETNLEKALSTNLKEQITVEDDIYTILRNRIEIIKNALEGGAIVIAHYEIVDMLEKIAIIEKATDTVPENDFYIKSYLYKGVEKIYSVQHPASTRISHEKIRKLLEKVKSVYD